MEESAAVPGAGRRDGLSEGQAVGDLSGRWSLGFWVLVGWCAFGLWAVWGEWTGTGWASPLLRDLTGAVGGWSPLVYVLVYAAAMTLMLPSCVATAWGAVAYGTFWGFVYAWLGGMLGAAGAFWVGRALGRKGLRTLGGEAWARFDGCLRKRGMITVFLLRLSGAPLTHVSVWMGVTGIGFREYMVGTGLGTAAGTLAFSWLVGNAWSAAAGSSGLPQWLGMLAAAAFLLLTARLGKRFLRRC